MKKLKDNQKVWLFFGFFGVLIIGLLLLGAVMQSRLPQTATSNPESYKKNSQYEILGGQTIRQLTYVGKVDLLQNNDKLPTFSSPQSLQNVGLNNMVTVTLKPLSTIDDVHQLHLDLGFKVVNKVPDSLDLVLQDTLGKPKTLIKRVNELYESGFYLIVEPQWVNAN